MFIPPPTEYSERHVYLIFASLLLIHACNDTSEEPSSCSRMKFIHQQASSTVTLYAFADKPPLPLRRLRNFRMKILVPIFVKIFDAAIAALLSCSMHVMLLKLIYPAAFLHPLIQRLFVRWAVRFQVFKRVISNIHRCNI